METGICLGLLNFLAFQSFDFHVTRWWSFKKRVVYTKLDIYFFINFPILWPYLMKVIQETCRVTKLDIYFFINCPILWPYLMKVIQETCRVH